MHENQIILISVTLSLILVWSAPLFGLDEYSQTAEKQTQELLKNKKLRAKAVKSGDAKKADDYVSNLADHDQDIVQKIYELSADTLPVLVNKTDGDPQKMTKILEDFQRDPASFADQWTPEQRAKLEEISKRLGPVVHKN